VAKMVQRICRWRNCRRAFLARKVDVNRGWGEYCSKICKAKSQEARTGQYAALRENDGPMSEEDRIHEVAMSASEEGWDGHK
jgi:hypothetical protein